MPGHIGDRILSTPTPSPTTPYRRRIAREFGVEILDNPRDPRYKPTYEPNAGEANIRYYDDSRFTEEDLEFLGSDGLTSKEFLRERRRRAKVYEPVPVLPVIVDFSEVMEPLYPHRAYGLSKYSTAPEAETYRGALSFARSRWPGKDAEAEMARNEYYWGRMEAGTLGENFNPYRPNTAKHEAFKQRVTLVDDRPMDPQTQLLMTQRQARRRAERKLKKGMHLSEEEFQLLFKPLNEWDLEELKRGYPRNGKGNFARLPPSAMMRAEMKEKIREELTRRVRHSLDVLAVDSLRTIEGILGDNEIDGRGRPIVPASVKMKAAEFALDHMLGKATQRTESDISVKLSAILGEVMVAPGVELTQDGVVTTGDMRVGQRGQRQGYTDEALRAVYGSTLGRHLAIENVIDAEIVGEDEEDD